MGIVFLELVAVLLLLLLVDFSLFRAVFLSPEAELDLSTGRRGVQVIVVLNTVIVVFQNRVQTPSLTKKIENRKKE